MPEKRANQWCSQKGGLPYFETSAKEAVNVENAFQKVAELALAQETDADALGPDFQDQIRLGQSPAAQQPARSGCGC